MTSICHRRYLSRHLPIFLLALVVHCATGLCQPSTILDAQAAVCEFKTINYITHTLPQQCLKTSWPGQKGPNESVHTKTDDPRASPDDPMNTFGGHHISLGPSLSTTGLSTDATADNDPTPRPFMSFEDWKEMMLRKAGQDPSDLKSRKSLDRTIEAERAARSPGLDSLGDDGEIDLNFDVVSEKISNIASAPQATPTEITASELQQEPVLYDDGRTQYYRSKDAGKTCKERFSYSSFDAGATVLKTNKGAKNAKAILVENKDSYMLLECSAENKFVIVELSDDILVDTVVLANFEFFSSMIRRFRVSVSDRYPVKVDKWKDLGTFEAKNSRDIQPFLVQNPLIWAKYVRIEFLTHYGNEFYCPVSLLRVHGTRMLESWKDQETPAEDEDVDEPAAEVVGPAKDNTIGDTIERRDNVTTSPRGGAAKEANSAVSVDPLMPIHIFRLSDDENATCLSSATSTYMSSASSASAGSLSKTQGDSDHATIQIRSGMERLFDQTPEEESSASTTDGRHIERNTVPSAVTSGSSPTYQSSVNSDMKAGGASETSNSGASSTRAPSQATTQARNKNNSTAAPASPTVQESFFKAVSKRLQYLESNVSLSLKYIEEQSRSLQATQLLAERKQLSRIDLFLDSLNHTVLSELRTVRQQYDQIWQSTVIALESQREQSQRETVALSSRLNILADEVVFQKRMAIVQAILLLSCLILVIFSRAMTQPILTGSFDLGRSPSRNHRLPSSSLDRGLRGAYIPRYDKFGRPYDNDHAGEGELSDRNLDMHRPIPDASTRLLTPASDARYSHRPDTAMTPELLPVEEFMESDPDSSYRESSPGSDIRSPSDETFEVSNSGQIDHEYPSEIQDQTIAVLADSVSVYARGSHSSTLRKPLPALPEYPH
ncbi:UNC-like C-terminal-domain-containing protein [Colletotrichum navitas]|uniref:UNC-like C-terminal-domain-containing protein n=1 Tax=Colletotrichum navitas TaxID=681940 RepID=A0AAD8QA35_9PEZI|nr:UNC-like C-terminal-domain-containing protein [Colletotrichum navitas]KAK1598815.1 UNC-like C-terminal-domain-containing protein [Colletotrichum navitas]